MAHIKSQLLEETVPLWSIRLIEGYRLFSVIQQNVQDPKPNLTVRNIESFLNKFYLPEAQSKAAKIVSQLNRQSLQMSQEKFAVSLTKYMRSVQLTNDESLTLYYKKVKDFLALNFVAPGENFEKWDIDGVISSQTLIDRKNNIGLFYNELQPYIDGMELYTFQGYLQRLNYCLSVISVSTVQSEVFKVYKTFINPTVMGHISDFLATIGLLQSNPPNSQLLQSIISQTDNVVRYFALISHFYSACKYRQLKEKLQTTPCLFYHQTFKATTFAMSIPENKIQRQVAICLSLLSKYVEGFSDWILASIDGNFMPFLNSIANVKDQQAAYYSLICLKNIIKRYRKKPEAFRNDPKNQKTMQQIQEFSLYLLKSIANIELQKQCLQLIAQILRVSQVNYKQIQQLKMTTKVFEVQLQYQTVLVPATLSILEVAIQRKLDDITNMIINDPAFLTCLQTHLTLKESVFFYQFLHIAYLLSAKHITFLIDKEILAKIVKMMFDEPNPTVSSVGCEILFNAVQSGLENEQILETLYDKFSLFDRVVPFLFKKCFEKSAYLDLFMSVQTQNNFVMAYNYFDKYNLLNVFKILYSLAVGISRRHKKYAFSRRLNEEIIKSVSNILEDLFKSQNRPLVEIVLKERLKMGASKKVSSENGIPLYKAINTILEEMTYNPDNKSIQILRIIDHELSNFLLIIKESFGQNLLKSQIFTLHELQVQNIPLYIKINVEFDDRNIKRTIPHKFQLSSLKSYLRSFVIAGTDYKANQVKDVIIKYKPTNRIIQNQVQYRSLVNKALQNRVTDFEWIILDIKWKNRRQDLSSSYVIPNYNEPSMRSYREPNLFANRMATSRQIPNVSVSRFTTLRENPSQHDARRNYYSPINFNYTYDRGSSPAFGGSGNRNR